MYKIYKSKKLTKDNIIIKLSEIKKLFITKINKLISTLFQVRQLHICGFYIFRDAGGFVSVYIW